MHDIKIRELENKVVVIFTRYPTTRFEITHMIERILTRIKCESVFQGGRKVTSSRIARSDDYGWYVRLMKYTKNDLELQVGV